MQDGKVAGIVAKNADGYIKINSSAVVLACGSFGGNQAMMNDLMPDMYNALVEGENLGAMMGGRDGSGVKMGYWAGTRLETNVAGMNMKGLAVPGKMNVLPQAMWIDENGKRFCNEFWQVAEQRGYQDIFQTRKTKYAIVDDNFDTYRQYTLPQHAGFYASEENIQALRDSMDEAYSKFNGTYVEDSSAADDMGGGAMSANTFIADDTLEGLADQLGLDEEAKANFLAQVEEYNGYCDTGVDLQFGRPAEVLFPVAQAPFYAVEFDPVLGETMVACGGLITNGDQNCLDKDYEPITGLYASGNDCGRRFGYEYVTPIPGCSLGFAITLGRECGKSVCEFLDAQ
jgi:fumarate reductase flavoprotein subunit